MVQQMIDTNKLSEHGLANGGTAFPTFDKQQSISAKKTVLRDLQNENRNITAKQPGNSPLPKEREPLMDAVKVCGSKRPQSDCLASSTFDQPPCNNGANGQLVYIRRKAEQELGKMNASNMENIGSPQSGKFGTDRQELHGQINQMQEPKVSCSPVFTPMPGTSLTTFSSGGLSVPHCFRKPINGVTVAEPSYSSATATTGIPLLFNRQRTSNQLREQRFLQLQLFLKNCDQSSQEEYIKMLRSLSAAGRGKHAVELEKRAIHLFLEEGKEMQRVKALNALGKSTPISYMPTPTEARPLQPVPVKREYNT
ncbi:uncharacterized protein LOC131243308 [Magnolia sinica]|uniref:uncharacterized protein LOC131243308 n=1 Tax=Magnolia sinica TaxID=86752 RepID=UPI002659E12E|nr:uncharacterized protein LOC131243308 [Magnolia sinica]XP_058098535.1 uncharacterized protein LOC131243308 [Magnolia sinica]